MELAWTIATTAASSATSHANAHLAAKEEAAAVGGAGMAKGEATRRGETASSL